MSAGAQATMDFVPHDVHSRRQKRTLVRWDDNLNELLLLTIQSVCNAGSIKIPWAKVAEIMGETVPAVTEGAIIQHLAKLRSRRLDAGKAVPPPLRRGGGGANRPSMPVRARATAPAPTARRRTRARKIKKDPESDEESEHEVVPSELFDVDSGSEYSREPRRKKFKHGWARRRKADEESDVEQDEASDDELLASGASFLDYPNVSQSNTLPPMEESKIVVLKYGQGESSNPRDSLHGDSYNDTQLPQSESAELANSYTQSANWLPGMTYGAPEQGFMDSNANPFEDYHGSNFVASGQDMLSYDPSAAGPSFGDFPHRSGSEMAGAYHIDSFEELLSSSTFPPDFPMYEGSSHSNTGNMTNNADGNVTSLGFTYPPASDDAVSRPYLSFETSDDAYQ